MGISWLSWGLIEPQFMEDRLDLIDFIGNFNYLVSGQMMGISLRLLQQRCIKIWTLSP